MSKRNITYIKPKDPSFLEKLKAEIGYKEGPTVDTKRQKFEDEGSNSEDELQEREDEKPQIVVIKAGDLTAEEAETEKRRIKQEEAARPADLNQRIIFKPKAKPVDPDTIAAKAKAVASAEADATPASITPSANSDAKKKKNKDKKKATTTTRNSHSKLSFNEDVFEEEEEDTV